MGIWCYQLRNVGEKRAVAYCGKDASESVLNSNDTQTPDWCIGYQEDPLVISTFGSESLTWRINDGDWELHVAASEDRGSTFKEVGIIKILNNYARFNVWIQDNSIVIGNDDHKLGRDSDGESFRYFHVFKNQISPSNYSPV